MVWEEGKGAAQRLQILRQLAAVGAGTRRPSSTTAGPSRGSAKETEEEIGELALVMEERELRMEEELTRLWTFVVENRPGKCAPNSPPSSPLKPKPPSDQP